MLKYKKISIILIIFLLFPLLLNNIVNTQKIGRLPLELIAMEKYPYIGEYIPFYLFWGSVIVVLLLILLFLFICFYPNNKTDIYISKSKGNLSIKRKAIEQFVHAALFKEQWLTNLKVSVVMKKKNIKILISGDCRVTDTNMIGKTAELSSRLKQELITFLGIENDKQIVVEIKGTSNEKSGNQRVV